MTATLVKTPVILVLILSVSLLVQFFDDGADFGGALSITDYCPFQQVCCVGQSTAFSSAGCISLCLCSSHRCSSLQVAGGPSVLSLATLLLATLPLRPTPQPHAALSRARCGLALAGALPSL